VLGLKLKERRRRRTEERQEKVGRIKTAIIGSGNIGTDLMIKIAETSKALEVGCVIGIDPDSEGLAMARERGIATTHEGIEGAQKLDVWSDIKIAFDATSAYAHQNHSDICAAAGKQMVDLTPAAIGPYCVPVVNMDQHLSEPNVNMVTCGGQATIPMVYAVSRVSESVPYGEIVASVSSRSAGPGTRANIDEFTRTTARGIEQVGGAKKGKAIIVLNPAEPPMIMRDTVYALSVGGKEDEIRQSVADMVRDVQAYVPGYRLKQDVQFERFSGNQKLHIPGLGTYEGVKVSIFLEVEGAGHYLPKYAGNLDIMTSAGMGTAEAIARKKYGVAA
jgi:acetaldehyde dehydrogenase